MEKAVIFIDEGIRVSTRLSIMCIIAAALGVESKQIHVQYGPDGRRTVPARPTHGTVLLPVVVQCCECCYFSFVVAHCRQPVIV